MSEQTTSATSTYSGETGVRKIAVLISGSGTNLQALIDACSSSTIPNARITLVFSNRKAAYGLTRAANASPPIPTDYLALQPFLKAGADRTRVDYDLEVARRVLVHSEAPRARGSENLEAEPEVDLDLIVLAGWMHVLSGEFLQVINGQRPYAPGRTLKAPIPIINLHPALPGAFDGSNALSRAWEAAQRGEIHKTGAMMHRVVQEVDRGEPIIVEEVEIRNGESLEELEGRVHEVEHRIIVEAVRKILAES
ncbi:hypothetical protein BOTBODRAFT_173109 [Botryobasidium botryosum FD-172 SS1]|uniref:phosphoribosylglycinamide formyltransferase 1 n=1 Tax=Botryobasidium botryosum (strain FD-172 SS1) TaxID=930990 RepID=A0A067MK94_BOTB1|nr:hypothetical protein BOTBODRAFT_173109 [Botryobasidium botryosum FD-172 SS1]